MANPSLKNGYISVANELVEKLALVNIPGNEMRMIWVLWRKTWGWKEGSRKKDWDWISYTQFEKLTGIKRRNCISCLQSLVSKSILFKEKNLYKFNQNYDSWVVCKRTLGVQKDTIGSVQKQTVTSVQKQTHKRNKETITKEIPEQGSEVSGMVIDLFKEINSSYKILFNRKPQHEASKRLLEREGYEKLEKIVKFIQTRRFDKFCPQISSPYQLEEKWSALEKYALGLKGEKEKYKIAF